MFLFASFSSSSSSSLLFLIEFHSPAGSFESKKTKQTKNMYKRQQIDLKETIETEKKRDDDIFLEGGGECCQLSYELSGNAGAMNRNASD